MAWATDPPDPCLSTDYQTILPAGDQLIVQGKVVILSDLPDLVALIEKLILRLSIHNTSVFAFVFAHLRLLVGVFLQYLDITLQQMREAWEDILMEMDSKLMKFAEEKQKVCGGSVSNDFLRLLMVGKPRSAADRSLPQTDWDQWLILQKENNRLGLNMQTKTAISGTVEPVLCMTVTLSCLSSDELQNFLLTDLTDKVLQADTLAFSQVPLPLSF